MSSLLSSRPTDSNFTVALHPLVLLTVSDQITRHQIRDLQAPVAGAIIGRQNGRDISAEHAFPLKLAENTEGWIIDLEWMERRIQQYKDVHKAPALEITGWYTLCPATGPTPALAVLQKQILDLYNENAILLAIHPEAITSSDPSNATPTLPLSVYESVVEAEQVKDESSMQVDGENNQGMKFAILPYTIETDETEMIAIDYIAKGAGSAVAVAEEERPPSPAAVERTEKKGKKRADAPAESEKQPNGTKESNPLTSEEEDQIAGITSRLNSVRMLQSRLSSLSQFLQSLPPSCLSDPNMAFSELSPDPTHLMHLRSIQALLTRLALLTPARHPASGDQATMSLESLNTASLSQANDVTLSSLLSLLAQNIQGMGEMGRKFTTVEQAKSQRNKNKGGAGHGGFPGIEDDSRMGLFMG